MLSPSQSEMSIPKPARAPWRQRLVDAETGFRIGFRTDSTLFMYLFVGSGVLFAGFVFNLQMIEWVILILALGWVLTVELFHQLLILIVKEFRHHLRKDVGRMMRLGTAAVVTTNVTAFVVLSIIFGSRLLSIWNG